MPGCLGSPRPPVIVSTVLINKFNSINSVNSINTLNPGSRDLPLGPGPGLLHVVLELRHFQPRLLLEGACLRRKSQGVHSGTGKGIR